MCPFRAYAAGPDLRLRLESAFGFDSNIAHLEEVARQTDLQGKAGVDANAGPVGRLVLDVEDAVRLGAGWTLSAGYHGGAKYFFEQPDENVLFQRADGVLRAVVAPWCALGLRGRLDDRTTRAALQPRDYTRVRGGPELSFAFAGTRVTLEGRGERLRYKPDAALSYDGLGASLSGAHRFERFVITGAVGFDARDFDGRSDRADPASPPREDEAYSAAVGLQYVSSFVADAEYVFVLNRSNAEDGGLVRHAVNLSATADLPWSFILSGRVGIQRFIYENERPVIDGFLEDEGRSSVTLRVERPLWADLSAVVHGGYWFSPFDSGPDYERYTVLGGVAWNHDG